MSDFYFTMSVMLSPLIGQHQGYRAGGELRSNVGDVIPLYVVVLLCC